MVVCAHGSKELVSRDDWTIRHWRNKPEADLWGGENRRVLIIEETNPFVLAKGQQNSAARCEIWPARTKSIASTLALVYVSLQVVVRRGNIMACEENSSRWNRALYIDRDNLSLSYPFICAVSNGDSCGCNRGFSLSLSKEKILLYLIVTECSICCVALGERPTCSRRKFISLINYFYFILLFESQYLIV